MPQELNWSRLPRQVRGAGEVAGKNSQNSPPAPRCRCKYLAERWMGCCPSYFHRSSGFSCEGLGLHRAVRRAAEEWSAGVRTRECARGGGAASLQRALTRAPGGAGVSAARGSCHARRCLQAPAADHPLLLRSRPPGPAPARPLHLSCARPLALSPSLRTRARSLRTWRLSLPGPGQGPRILRPAPRAEGCDWNRRPSRAGRSGCRAGAAGPPRAPSSAHWVPRHPRAPGCWARLLSDANARVAGAGRRGEGSELPGELGVRGRRRRAEARPRRAPGEAELFGGREAGVGIRVEFPWRPQVTARWPWAAAPPGRTGWGSLGRGARKAGADGHQVQRELASWGREQIAAFSRWSGARNLVRSPQRGARGTLLWPGMDRGKTPRWRGVQLLPRSETAKGCVPERAGVQLTICVDSVYLSERWSSSKGALLFPVISILLLPGIRRAALY